MKNNRAFVTNLELRESKPDGSEGAGLSHTAKGMFLLHVLEMAAEGEPRGGLAILHMAGDHGGRYQDVGQFFAERGWAVALPDFRGHGNSEGERGHSWGIKEALRDIGSVLDHLAYRLPDAPRVLIAQGLGGLYALAYALDQGDNLAGLVLINPLLEPKLSPPQKPGGLKGLFKKLTPLSAGQFEIRPEDLLSDPSALQSYSADPLNHNLASLHVFERLPGEARAVRERLSELKVPTLLLLSEGDPLCVPDVTARLLSPQAEIKRWPGAKHDLLHEACQAQVLETIEGWLRRGLRK